MNSQRSVNALMPFAIACALVAAVGVPARAQALSPTQEQTMIQKELQKDDEVYFGGCDGYGAARKTGDGMTATAVEVFGIHPMLEAKSGDTVRRTPAFGLEGIADCGAALSDLQSFPQFWVRKVSLLRARALHRFAVGDVVGAQTDLTGAEAAAVAPSDPFYARSLKLALAFERAYVLSRTGKQADAEALAMGAWESRPYSRQVTYSAIVAIGPGGDPSLLNKLARRLEALDPEGRGGAPMFLLPPAPPDAALPSLPTAGQDVVALYDVLPEPETSQRIAPAADNQRLFAKDQLTQGLNNDSPVAVLFYGANATLSIAEEQSLLRAAIAARTAGKRALKVVRRDDTWHMRTKNIPVCTVLVGDVLTIVRIPGCSWSETYTNGFESDLAVTFSSEGSAASGDGDGPQALDADAIYQALAPVYLTASTTPAAP